MGGKEGSGFIVFYIFMGKEKKKGNLFLDKVLKIYHQFIN